METEKMILLASDISVNEKKSNELFLYVEMRMQSTQPNGNGEGVTEAFIDSIILNQEMYNCLPLYADVDCLLAHQYRSQGHKFDRNTRTFGTQQIGSMCGFRKVQDQYGYSLIGEARIPKRDLEICLALAEMYELGMQNFSFEIYYYPSDTVTEAGVKYIQASERNLLRGMCVVSVPAYKESVALDMVAEEEHKNTENEEQEEGRLDAPETIKEPDEEDDQKNNEGVETMNIEEAMGMIAEKDQKIADLEAQLAAAEEQKAQELEEEKAKKDEAAEQAEASLTETKEALEAANNTIAGLEAKVAELEAVKAELDGIKAEQAAAEQAKKLEKVKAFAEKQGLDVTVKEVADAIAEMNYEAIADLAAAMEKPEEKAEETVASFVLAGEGIDMNDKYGDLLARR